MLTMQTRAETQTPICREAHTTPAECLTFAASLFDRVSLLTSVIQHEESSAKRQESYEEGVLVRSRWKQMSCVS
ncbi:hypothetical protein INR49_019886 [Caranx melampygus]|nr:hypothetical protein INR49_019886 [Caranx melampygus]